MGYTFVLGGARSGKSTYAERLTRHLSELHSLPVMYIATAEVSDDEMEARIMRHRKQRPTAWQTVEIPLQVAEWILKHPAPQVILINCFSLLLNNWMFLENSNEAEVFQRIDHLVMTLAQSKNPIVVVSNEVGQGIVPADGLSRNYRDWLGLMNQRIAAYAETVVWVIAGVPVDLKKIQVPLP